MKKMYAFLMSFMIVLVPLRAQDIDGLVAVQGSQIGQSRVTTNSLPGTSQDSCTLARLDGNSIQQNIRFIQGELELHKNRKRLCGIAAVAACAYGSYYLFLKGPSGNTPSMPQSQVAATVISYPENLNSQEARLARLTDILEKLDPTLKKTDIIVNQVLEEQIRVAKAGFAGTLKTWMSSTLNFVIREAAVSVAFSVVMGSFGKYFKAIDTGIDAVTSKLFHPDDLQWFIGNHTNIYALLHQLEIHAYCIEHQRLPKKANNDECSIDTDVLLSPVEIQAHKDAFATTWSLCVRHLELILGFMLFKEYQFDNTNTLVKEASVKVSALLAERCNQIILNMRRLIDDFAQNAEKLLANSDGSQSGLVESVNSFRFKFLDERSNFISLEKA